MSGYSNSSFVLPPYREIALITWGSECVDSLSVVATTILSPTFQSPSFNFSTKRSSFYPGITVVSNSVQVFSMGFPCRYKIPLFTPMHLLPYNGIMAPLIFPCIVMVNLEV